MLQSADSFEMRDLPDTPVLAGSGYPFLLYIGRQKAPVKEEIYIQ